MEPAALVTRLVAVLAADAVGFSQSMARDDHATVRALDAARAIFRRRIALHAGRVVDTAGDSVLAVFHTAMGATSAALEVQSELNAEAESTQGDHALRFRIGLHLGDVVEKADGSVYGDGVNLAARLQALAPPGTVVASESLRLAVRGKSGASFEPLGEQHLKNMGEPIRAHRVVSGVSGMASMAGMAAGPAPVTASPLLSILVLPFANHTGLASKAYIADALTASVTSDLTRIEDLFVVPAVTAFTYKDRGLTLAAIGREAGVRFVLQGSVMASGRQLRIAAQLADTRRDLQLWNETFDGEVRNFFALLDQVTARVGNSIGKLMVIAAAPASDSQAADAATGDLLLRARALTVQTQSLQRFGETAAIYRRVLERDGANLAAMAGLATVLAIHASWLEASDPALTGMLAEARDLALAVTAVDPSDRRVQIPIALSAQHLQDFDAARTAWETLLRLNPKGPGAHINLAVFHLAVGEPASAVPLLERALQLHPKGSANLFTALGVAHFALGDDDAAIARLSQARDLRFENPDVFSHLAMAHANKGDTAKAATFVAEYRTRAEAAGIAGPRVHKPGPASPAAYAAYFHGKLLPDWERAGLP